MSDDLLDLLGNVGLTEYESRAYAALLSKHVTTAAQLSMESRIPRTKVYEVLESLVRKGWAKVYSGYLLLFRPVDPSVVLEKKVGEFRSLVDVVRSFFDKEETRMKERFVITNFDIGMPALKRSIENARTIWISNATAKFMTEVEDSIDADAETKIVLFPGEKYDGRPGLEVKPAQMRIVSLVQSKETPSMSVTLDEERIFTVIEHPP